MSSLKIQFHDGFCPKKLQENHFFVSVLREQFPCQHPHARRPAAHALGCPELAAGPRAASGRCLYAGEGTLVYFLPSGVEVISGLAVVTVTGLRTPAQSSESGALQTWRQMWGKLHDRLDLVNLQKTDSTLPSLGSNGALSSSVLVRTTDTGRWAD